MNRNVYMHLFVKFSWSRALTAAICCLSEVCLRRRYEWCVIQIEQVNLVVTSAGVRTTGLSSTNFRVPGPPVFQCATLKNWVGPGKIATGLHIVTSRLLY